MSLPPLPDSYMGTGYAFIEELEGGWYSVALWGREGWDLGRWPHQLVVHYDAPQDGGAWGFCSFTEGDLDLKEFATREERDKETDRYFCWFNVFHEVAGAPKQVWDMRLGPFRP